jgi:hypothetical protein
MEPSQKLTSTTIQDFPQVPASTKASKADISRAQLALNKIAFNFLAKFENEPIDEELFMRLACTWSQLDSELCSRVLIDDKKSKSIPNVNLTSEKIQDIISKIETFGSEVKALAHPEVKDLKKPRIPYSDEVKDLETPKLPDSRDVKPSEKPKLPYSNKNEVKASAPPHKTFHQSSYHQTSSKNHSC